jgi:two-component system NarL family response regulator
VAQRRPNVGLMDLRMPGVDGTSCVERLSSDWPDVKTVVLSASDDRPSIDAALLAGASAYIVKSATAVDVAAVLRHTSTGTVYHAPSAPARARQGLEPDKALLTERETVILEAIADGLTTRAISRDLWLSEHTVKFHLTNIYRKLGVTNRSGALRFAFDRQLATASEAAASEVALR